MAGGRPLKWKSAEAMQQAIDAYFKNCQGHPLIGEDGRIATDEQGVPIIVGARPQTVTGLALALGFSSRQSLLNYQKKAEFADVISCAKLRCEKYAEEGLYDKDRQRGAIYALRFGFRWNGDGKSSEESSNSADCGVVELPAAMDAPEPREKDVLC